MRYQLQFRTASFGGGQLPKLPKTGPVSGFAGGVLVGTVAAVTIFGGTPARNNAVALVDVSDSMAKLERPLTEADTMEGRLQAQLTRLKKSGVSPAIIRTTGFGLASNRGDANLLGAFQNAVSVNPNIRSAYVFSDFACQSPSSYDASDVQGQQQFYSLLRDRHISLSIYQLAGPPDGSLVAMARTTGGNWYDPSGKVVKGKSGSEAQNVTLKGTVRTARDQAPVRDAKVMAGGHVTYTDEHGVYRFESNQFPSGPLDVTVAAPGSLQAKIPVTVEGCHKGEQKLEVNVPLVPDLKPGETMITLDWRKNGKQPDDLDLHLTGARKLHVYFDERGQEGFAHLDFDNVAKEDPADYHPPAETLHVWPRIARDSYQVDVCDYRGELGRNGIIASQATVRVFDRSGLVREFHARKPDGGQPDRDWTVFRWNGRNAASIQPVDTYGDGNALCKF